MSSSTSSSRQRLPALRWAPVLAGAAGLALLFALALEVELARRGVHAALADSEALWVRQRLRASELGPRALVLVGSSRAQSNVDLGVLRKRTGLEPVQLAIPAANFVPVFEGLADDPDIRGTIVVDAYDDYIMSSNLSETAMAWQGAFDRLRGSGLLTFEDVERSLSHHWRSHWLSYAAGAQPLHAIRRHVLSPGAASARGIALDRSLAIDFRPEDLPWAYYAVVAHGLGRPRPARHQASWAVVEREYRAGVLEQQPRTKYLDSYRERARRLRDATRTIEARGGRVRFVMLPKSGLVRELDDRWYPRELFWDSFARDVGVPTLHFEDVEPWRALEIPDGSHLDMRSRELFTHQLIDALQIAE